MGKEIKKMQLHYLKTTLIKLKMSSVLQPLVIESSVCVWFKLRLGITTLGKNSIHMLSQIVADKEHLLRQIFCKLLEPQYAKHRTV